MVSVKWRPLSIHSLKHSGSSASPVAACWEKFLPLLPWCSVSNPPFSLVCFRTPCSWDILWGRSIATRDTRSDEYWISDEISSGSRQNRCLCNTFPQQKPDALQTCAPWQLKAVSLARRALKDKFPTPTVSLITVLPNRHVFLPDPVII